jgi:hypothetical protein
VEVERKMVQNLQLQRDLLEKAALRHNVGIVFALVLFILFVADLF